MNAQMLSTCPMAHALNPIVFAHSPPAAEHPTNWPKAIRDYRTDIRFTSSPAAVVNFRKYTPGFSETGIVLLPTDRLY
jgi:hypothetical protein